MSLLTVRNLKKSYRGPDGVSHEVLNIIELALERGEHLALRGASGTGKTTLLNIIAGIMKPDAGEVLLSGQCINRMSEPRRDRFRAEQIGYIFQTFNLLQGFTALENVVLGTYFRGRTDKARSRQLLEKMGLSERMDYLPGALSTGQQQRVAVARALANRPSLVIADEPTGNLDPESASNAIEIIRSHCREEGAALLLVSHDPGILAGFDRTLDLKEINRTNNREDHGGAE